MNLSRVVQPTTTILVRFYHSSLYNPIPARLGGTQASSSGACSTLTLRINFVCERLIFNKSSPRDTIFLVVHLLRATSLAYFCVNDTFCISLPRASAFE